MGIIRFFGRDEMDEGCRAKRPGTITGTFNHWPQEAYRPGGTQQVAGKRIRAACRAIGDMTSDDLAHPYTPRATIRGGSSSAALG